MKQSISATVRGTSMQPTLYEGDLVELSPVKEELLESGAIYAFTDAVTKDVIGHRYLGEENGTLMFQGDNQPTAERVAANLKLWRVERVLDRRMVPPTTQLVYGLLKHIDRLSGYHFPKNTTACWDWKAIFDYIRLERVLTGLAFTLKQSTLWTEVPEKYRALFQTVLHEECVRWERFGIVKEELQRLLPHVRFIKGAKLGPELYPMSLLRTMRDLDALVPPGSFETDVKLLLANGFKTTDESLDRSRHFTQLTFIHETTGVEVELHHALFLASRFAFRPNDLYQSGDCELELVYLCAHAISHWGQHGICYWDVYRLLFGSAEKQQCKLNLATATLKAVEREALLPLCFALRVLKNDWNIEYANEVERGLTPFQRIRLGLADLFFLRRPTIPMISFQKRVFQALLTDRILSLVRHIFDPKRIYLTHLSGN